jgi:hypothetical protein
MKLSAEMKDATRYRLPCLLALFLAVFAIVQFRLESVSRPWRSNHQYVQLAIHIHPASMLGRADAFIFMADRWNPQNAIDGRYVWLPVEFRHGEPTISWHDEWDLRFFDK